MDLLLVRRGNGSKDVLELVEQALDLSEDVLRGRWPREAAELSRAERRLRAVVRCEKRAVLREPEPYPSISASLTGSAMRCRLLDDVGACSRAAWRRHKARLSETARGSQPPS